MALDTNLGGKCDQPGVLWLVSGNLSGRVPARDRRLTVPALDQLQSSQHPPRRQ